MSVNIINQRLGVNTRSVWYPEGAGAPGVDPGSPAGFALPLRDVSGYQIVQSLVEAPVYNLSQNPDSSVNGMIEAGGTLPLGLEFLTCPAFLRPVFTGYTKTNLPDGAIHDFYLPPPGTLVTAGSGQIQMESAESSALAIRARYNRVSKIAMQYQASGVTPFDVTLMGSGDYVEADLGGSKTYNGYKGVSQFNGQAFLNGLGLAGMPQFSLNLDAGVSKFGGAFNAGVYAGVLPGKVNITGNIEIAVAAGGAGNEADLAFFHLAVNQGYVPLDCLWANAPLNLMTQFMRVIMPTTRFGVTSPKFGGKLGISCAQDYRAEYDPAGSKTAAEVWGTKFGPYTIVTGTSDVFAVKIDGGSTISVTFAAGSKTAAQLVALLNADSGFTAVAVADVFGGYVRVTSKTKGSLGSVQFDTGTAHHCGALLGFNNTAISGYDTAVLFRVWNPYQTAYA